MRASLFSAALVAALVGFGSTIALVLAAAAAVGASPEQTASWSSLSLSPRPWQCRPLALGADADAARLVHPRRGPGRRDPRPHHGGGRRRLRAAGAPHRRHGPDPPAGPPRARRSRTHRRGNARGRAPPLRPEARPRRARSPRPSSSPWSRPSPVRLRTPPGPSSPPSPWGSSSPSCRASPAPRALGPSRPTLIAPEVRPAWCWSASPSPSPSSPWRARTSPASPPSAPRAMSPRSAPPLTTTDSSPRARACSAPTRQHGSPSPPRSAWATTSTPRTQRWKVGLAYAGVWSSSGSSPPLVIAAIAALPPPAWSRASSHRPLGPLTGALTGAHRPHRHRTPAVVTLAVTATGVAAFGVGAASGSPRGPGLPRRSTAWPRAARRSGPLVLGALHDDVAGDRPHRGHRPQHLGVERL
jgi:benzoate membrane transport protein